MGYEFADSDELSMLRQSVRKFAEKEIAPLAHDLDEKEEFSYELTQKMGELGLFGTIIDPKYGGQGMDYLSYVVAVEELARIDGSQAATIAAHNPQKRPCHAAWTTSWRRFCLVNWCTMSRSTLIACA